MFRPLRALEASERHSVALLFLYGFGNAAAYVICRTVADSAFLSQIGPEQLPKVYLLSAGVVALTSLVYARTVRVLGLRRVVLLTLVGLAGSSAVLPIAMHREAGSLTVFAAAYLLAQVSGSLGTIQYATLVNEQFAHRQPERVVGLVGAGATLAGIVVGLGIGFVAKYVHIESLLYLAAAIDLATMVPVLLLRSPRLRYSERGSPTSSSDETGLRDALASPYVLSIACLVVLCVVSATLVEFQWKVTAASELYRNKEGLAGYFGYFYGSVYFITGLLQLFVTGQVFRKRGVLAGLLAFPGALVATTLTALVASSGRMLLWTVTLTKGCDTLKRSMNDPATQVLYSPLPRDLRQQAITLVAGVAKPLAEAVAAVLLVVATPWISNRQLSLIILGLLSVWLLNSLSVFRGFVDKRSARGSGKNG